MSSTPYTKMQATPDFSNFKFTSAVQPAPIARQIRFLRTNGPELYLVDFRNHTADQKDDPNWPDSKDFNQVVATLTQIIEAYSERYPRRILRCCGDTRIKDLVFRAMLNRHYEQLSQMFQVASDQCILYRGPGHDQPMPFNIARKPIPYLTINTVRSTWSGVSRMFKTAFSVETDKNIRVGLTLPPI